MPVPAPAGLGDSLNVTALSGFPAARPLRLPAFSGKAEAAPAPVHEAPVPLASQQAPAQPQSERPHLQVSGSCTALPWYLSSLFLCLFYSASSFSLFLLKSSSFSRIPLHLDLFKSPIQLVFSSFSGIWEF